MVAALSAYICRCGSPMGRYDAQCPRCLADSYDRRPACACCRRERGDLIADSGPRQGLALCPFCYLGPVRIRARGRLL